MLQMLVQNGIISDEIFCSPAKYVHVFPQQMGKSVDFEIYLPGLNQRFQIGNASMSVYPDIQCINWNDFYPLDSLNDRPKQRGIGTAAHVSILFSLNRIYDNSIDYYTVQHTISDSSARCIHLASMGVHPGMAFCDYYTRCFDYAARKDYVPIWLNALR